LLNRTLKLAVKNGNGTVPEIDASAIPDSNPLKKIGRNLGDRVTQAYESLAFHEVCESVLELVRLGNRYIDEQAPWTLYKLGKADPKKRQEAEQIIYAILESVRLSAYLLAPIIPSTSTQIYQQLGYCVDFDDAPLIDVSNSFQTHSSWGILEASQSLGEAQPIFQKLELPMDDSKETS
jgi:methionyl-tRNA synthetase